jgi:lipoate---protein ligase
MNMLLIESPFNSIQQNLALEIYYLNQPGDFLLVYTCEKCVVCGQNQVVSSEVSIREQDYYDIPVFKRHSGGGTVFIDPGTLNYSFITDYSPKKSGYSYFNSFIVKILTEIGYQGFRESGSNIYLNDLKISGIAQYKRKGRLIHHGTLLIENDLTLMAKLLKHSENYKTKARRSVPAETANLSGIGPKLNFEEFKTRFLESLINNDYTRTELSFSGREYTEFKSKDFKEDFWTYGNTPFYQYSNKVILPGKESVMIRIEVESGRIVKQELIPNTTFFSKIDLSGNYHCFSEVNKFLSFHLREDLRPEEVKNICYQLF